MASAIHHGVTESAEQQLGRRCTLMGADPADVITKPGIEDGRKHASEGSHRAAV
jgi:hypothetical protein